MRLSASVLLVSAVALSACGGSSTSNVDSYNAKLDSHTRPMANEITSNTATALNAAPAETSATMSGTFRVFTPTIIGVNSIAGQMDMSADFAAGTVSGAMNRMVEVDDINFAEDISGSVTYSGTISVGTSSNDDILATGSGTVTGTDNTSYAVSTTMNGDFYRRQNNDLGAAGNIVATATSGTTTHNGSGAYVVTE